MQEKRTIITNAKLLRKEATKAEQILWKALRGKSINVKFRRQHPLDMFIIDFYAPSIKLAIEVDGSAHTTESNREYDDMRTNYLELKQIYVLRFWNSEIEKDLGRVLSKIKYTVQALSGTPERAG